MIFLKPTASRGVNPYRKSLLYSVLIIESVKAGRLHLRRRSICVGIDAVSLSIKMVRNCPYFVL
jgi:hypothetical protein